MTRDSRPASTLMIAAMPASMNTGDSDSWIVSAMVETVGENCIAPLLAERASQQQAPTHW